MTLLRQKYTRRITIGLLVGIISSVVFVIFKTQNSTGYVLLGAALGILFAVSRRAYPFDYIESMLTAAALGILFWVCFNCLLFPLLTGHSPPWTAMGMRQLFPELVAWVLYGACLGLLLVLGNQLAFQLLGPEQQKSRPTQAITTRIVIVGGGFAGMTVAQHLEQAFGADPTVSITIISDTNALLFTPMLAEVAGGSLEPSHICNPLRTSLRRTQVIHGCVTQIDTQHKQLTLTTKTPFSQPDTITYDHLVLAVGSISNFLEREDIRLHALSFKSIEDAIRIRGHAINMLEYADRETDKDKRAAMLTFVIAGAGFAGAELAGALNDLLRSALPYYPTIQQHEIRILLVHSRDHILPELSRSLADYAMTQMEARGVTMRLNTRLTGAHAGGVILNKDEEVGTNTLVWTAGVKPHPLVQTLAADHDSHGAIAVDQYLAVPALSGVWALGDCALVNDAVTHQPCPPTAQFALREAYTLAHNIHAGVHYQPLKPFHFNALGILCVVGYQTACAEIKGLRFSGFFAWILWRGIYLSKLPGLERKIRVLSDWIIEIFFPRDIVQTIDLDERPTTIMEIEQIVPPITGSQPRG
ncbi:NAD(P)/FAD-dependent oxidoreductase [Dictyobacter kobayashii]|uniref:NADH:ubiquinone reductase (non-electrogenic) n=1 Tax=Dictyobacter kobayashii TaxID=2014872 RepID=A0A402AXK4_9CHLR|nr:NAD(P)/FAD-dependent oxidoreductase [Dictyobacter kobayashii]GCE23799.1 hypothetical protein KDK_75990 [Dictyobacter kobayashii]